MVKLQKSTQMQAECVEKIHIPLRLQHHLPPKPPQIVLQSTKPNAIMRNINSPKIQSSYNNASTSIFKSGM